MAILRAHCPTEIQMQMKYCQLISWTIAENPKGWGGCMKTLLLRS